MKTITLLFSLLFTQFIMAQFHPGDVGYWIGEGSKSVILVADFKTDYSPHSYAWGYRFEEDDTTMEDLINAVGLSVPGITFNTEGGYLSQFDYYHHEPIDNYWSTWSGTTFETLVPNMGIATDILQNGHFYAISFGFGPEPEYEAYAPDEPVAAYNPDWFSSENITEWNGEGDHESVVVIDFGTDQDGIVHSYAFGVRFEEEEISNTTLLNIIETHTGDFSYHMTENQITTLSFMDNSGVASETEHWTLYRGDDLASWYKVENMLTPTTDLTWTGFSFGNRMPFTPQDAALDTEPFGTAALIVYPNPTTERLFISSHNHLSITIYDTRGKKIVSEIYTPAGIDVRGLDKGTYILQIEVNDSIRSYRFIKK